MNEINKKIEKEHERKSWAIAIGLHACFFILSGLGLFSCWTKPDPLIGVSEVGIIFGKTDVGSGENTEPAENPVENPNDADPTDNPTPEQPTESQTAPAEAVDNTFTDADSDVSTPDVVNTPDATAINDKPATADPVKNPDPVKPDVTKTDNNSSDAPKTDESNPNAMMGGGDEGHGDDGETGAVGDPTGMSANDGGTGGQSDTGAGTGLKIDGWKFNQDPPKPNITTPGIAHIEFKINSFGKIISAKVIGGAYSASERAIIITEFKKISLSKTSNVAYKTTYSGTYDWKLAY